ncbi:MAG: hypothetical protein K2X82_24290 [Gemmataceae bacterium]|nr:hypothetical protein [Gemmataceae bacterium]
MRTPTSFTLLAFALLTAAAAGPPPPPAIPPRTVTLELTNSTLKDVVAALSKRTGLLVTYPEAVGNQPCDAVFNGKPFWDALELVADQTGLRIEPKGDGRDIALVPRGKSREVSSVAGPFRVVARQVVGRYLLDEGTTAYEVQLGVHWEPRLPVFRIDGTPTITEATDDRGTALTPQTGGSRTQPAGYAHAATVRLGGLTREAKRVGTLKGYFTVVASEKFLTFRFADLTGKPPVALPAQEGVTATLRRLGKDEGTWEVEVVLTYPPTIPEFESFEAWAAGNRVVLVSPDGTKVFAPESRNVNAAGRQVVGTYYFKEDPAKGLVNPAGKGWSLVVEAPTTPVEFKVPFELKDVPLP